VLLPRRPPRPAPDAAGRPQRPRRLVDYAYVIAPDRLQVLTNLHGGWQPIADPAWTDTPDWEAIDRHAKQLRRQY
jgi:hypothetical protein